MSSKMPRRYRSLKRCSKSVAVRERQIQTTMSYHYTTIRMTKIEWPNAGEDAEKLDHSYVGSGEVNSMAAFRKNLAVYYKTKYTNTNTIQPRNFTLEHLFLGNGNVFSHKNHV